MQPDLVEKIKRSGTPLVDGERVTFVWRGREAPLLMGDFTGWDSEPVKLEKVGRGLWAYSSRFPLEAYLEYAYIHPKSGERLEDPYNPRRVSNGVGDWQHWFSMPAAAHTSLANRRRTGARGEVLRCQVATEGLARGRQRAVVLYRPVTPGPYPLLVVLDGQDYLSRGRLVNIVDNLIALKRIRPIAMALVANGGTARMLEYGCSESTLIFLSEIVLPLAQRELDLIEPARSLGANGILGASMGGLMALFAGLRAPHIFGRVLSQSGAFALDGYDFVVKHLVRHLPPVEIQVWLDVGQFESLLEPNRAMHHLLREHGYAVAFREFPAGHNFIAWRNDVWRGLEYSFPAEERMRDEE